MKLDEWEIPKMPAQKQPKLNNTRVYARWCKCCGNMYGATDYEFAAWPTNISPFCARKEGLL